MTLKPSQPKLWNKDLRLITIAIFCMFTAFYMLMPIIAMYVVERFDADVSVAGAVVSIYIISSLLARPFSGFLVDKYNRKVFYFITYILFTILCSGYIFIGSILMIVILRILLGVVFSFVTTAGSTLAIDLMPSSRRGEGIGYMGAITVVSMAVGPMMGLYLMEVASYEGLFISAVACCFVGVLCAYFIKTKPHVPMKSEPLSLDRFFLKASVSIGIITAFLNFPYGVMMTYMPLYLKEANVTAESGNFFLYLAIGVVISRLSSGKLINKGYQNLLLQLGIVCLIVSLFIFTYHLNNTTFVISSLMIGMAYGVISPSLQSLIINLAPHSKRGTANSSYFISLDLGSGLGMLLGGVIAEHTNYQMIFTTSWVIIIIGFILYNTYAYKSYQNQLSKTKL